MQHVHLDASNQDNLHQRAVDCLQAGGVCILPTETVHGLMALASAQDARQRIYMMKQRDLSKELQVLLPDVTLVTALGVQMTDDLQKLARFWPGALTLVVEANDGQTYGIRIPNHPWLQGVLRDVNAPVVATSANAAGIPPEESLAKGFADLVEQPDLIVTGDLIGGVASTVALLKDGKLTCLREGAIPFADLETALAGGPA